MDFVRAIFLTCFARAGDHVEVSRDILAGRRAGEQREQGRDVLQLFNDLLDAGDGDVHWRYGRAHPAIALVFNQTQGAGFGDGKINPGQPDIGLAKLFAQHLAANLDQFIDIVGVFNPRHLFVKKFGDLFLGLVNRRHDDV